MGVILASWAIWVNIWQGNSSSYMFQQSSASKSIFFCRNLPFCIGCQVSDVFKITKVLVSKSNTVFSSFLITSLNNYGGKLPAAAENGLNLYRFALL